MNPCGHGTSGRETRLRRTEATALPFQNQDWPGFGTVTTTSYCADINVKPHQGVHVETCFTKTGCNGYRWVPAGTWGTAASGVLNGTQFYLHFSSPSDGLVAF